VAHAGVERRRDHADAGLRVGRQLADRAVELLAGGGFVCDDEDVLGAVHGGHVTARG